MNEIKIIKTKDDYQQALKFIEELVDRDPESGSVDADRLVLLTALVKDYESKAFPEHLPDPIEAIKFRMEQEDLKPADLVPYIGSPGRVSEVLSGKRQLTIDMVRALSAGLGIPAKVLIQKPSRDFEAQNWDTTLVRTMEQRGYFGKKTLKEHSKSELVNSFFALLGDVQPVALYRKTAFRSAPRTDNDALLAWGLRVTQKAEKTKVPKYKKGTVNLEFMRDVVRLSAQDKGPLLARDYLKQHGIKLIFEPHLPKTHLDGATLLADKSNPIIGLSVRHDRPDNFWFTLMHELAHIARDYDNDVIEAFYDEKLQEKDGVQVDEREKEADELAEESILPRSKWETSAAKRTPNQFSTQDLADDLGIQAAVIAGMIRFKHKKFYYLNEMIHDENLKIKKYFPEDFKE